MKVIFVGLKADPLLARLAEHLVPHGATIVHIDPLDFAEGDPMYWDGDVFMWRDVDVTAVDAIVVRRLPAERVRPADGVTVTAEDVERDGTEAFQRAQYFEAWLSEAAQRGVPVYNPPESRVFDRKPMQLATFLRAGLPIPRTMITNYGVAAELFADDVGEAIYKPVAGGRETELFDAKVRERLHLMGSTPIIFQQRIIGPDIRVTVIGGEIVSAVEIPSHPVDYRLGPEYRAGKQQYVPIELPKEVQAMALKAADLCHHAVSGIDFKRDDKTGAYVLLEANSAPVYLDIELKTGAPISKRLAELVMLRRLHF